LLQRVPQATLSNESTPFLRFSLLVVRIFLETTTIGGKISKHVAEASQ